MCAGNWRGCGTCETTALRGDTWLAPAHGGENSISATFVSAANPYAVVIAVGAANPAGDPQAETLALFEGRTILRTDQRGTITFATDGEQVWAEAER